MHDRPRLYDAVPAFYHSSLYGLYVHLEDHILKRVLNQFDIILRCC